MVQIQVMAGQLPPTVLADTFIPCINIVSAEPDLTLRDSVIPHEKDHSWHTYNSINQSNRIVSHRDREVTPAIEVKGLILFIHGSRNALIKEGEGTADRGDMDGKIGAIQDQDLSI